MMQDTQNPTTSAGGQAVPNVGAAGAAGATGASGTPADAGKAISPEVLQLLQNMLKSRQSIDAPPPKPASMGQNIKESIAGFIPIVGAGVQKAIKEQREYQVNDTVNKLQQYDSIYQELQLMAGGDKQKLQELVNQDPRLTAIRQDKKFVKGMSKVFGSDLLNPEKQNTVYHEAMKKHISLKQAKDKMTSAQSQMQQYKTNMDMLNAMPQKSVQPDPKTVEGVARIQAQAAESEQRIAEQKQRDYDSKEIRLQQLDQQRQAESDRKDWRNQSEEERKRHDLQMEKYNRDSLALRKELGTMAHEIALERLEKANGAKGLKQEYKAGLNVLHVALFGGQGQKGLVDSLGILDDPVSRLKLAAAPELTHTTANVSTFGSLMTLAKSSALNPSEREMVVQTNRAIGAINSLRSVTGLPRSTQELMNRYILELPNVVLEKSSAEGMNKLMLIQREIDAALATEQQQPATGGKAQTPAATGQTQDPYDKYKRKDK